MATIWTEGHAMTPTIPTPPPALDSIAIGPFAHDILLANQSRADERYRQQLAKWWRLRVIETTGTAVEECAP
jgi:hypothetical protein